MVQQNAHDDAADAATESDDDWQRRELCSDGNCIGVIGSNGCCKECGKPRSGTDSMRWTSCPENEPESDDPGEMDDSNNAGETMESRDGVDPYWADRRLCVDGNCIGVVGPDGKCRECGRVCDT
jgi:hypothetical protein